MSNWRLSSRPHQIYLDPSVQINICKIEKFNSGKISMYHSVRVENKCCIRAISRSNLVKEKTELLQSLQRKWQAGGKHSNPHWPNFSSSSMIVITFLRYEQKSPILGIRIYCLFPLPCICDLCFQESLLHQTPLPWARFYTLWVVQIIHQRNKDFFWSTPFWTSSIWTFPNWTTPNPFV